eukprot:2920195-Pleurochrysis_carterae.AAC.2
MAWIKRQDQTGCTPRPTGEHANSAHTSILHAQRSTAVPAIARGTATGQAVFKSQMSRTRPSTSYSRDYYKGRGSESEVAA